jgi:hypothetical protein
MSNNEAECSGSRCCSADHLSREFSAWAIFMTWTDTGEEMPAFKEIQGGFPWFKAKREAMDYIRQIRNRRNLKLSPIIKWSVRRVTLRMECP